MSTIVKSQRKSEEATRQKAEIIQEELTKDTEHELVLENVQNKYSWREEVGNSDVQEYNDSNFEMIRNHLTSLVIKDNLKENQVKRVK